MKKLIAIASMLFLLPLSAFGLTVMEDSQMNDITAQAGVSIAADVFLDLHVDTVAWGDSDGISGTEGWVGVSDMNADLWFGMRKDVTALGGSFDPADLQVLTIDVAQDAALYNGASYVRIGLGTFQLEGNMDMDFELGASQLLGEELGTLDITGMVVLGAADNYVDITTDGRNSGVTLNLNVLLDLIHMDALAWGDSDGVDIYNPAYTDAGFVGVTDMNITALDIEGLVAIDVATMGASFYNILTENSTPADVLTLAATDYQSLVMWKLAYLKFNAPTQISDTAVILTLGNGDGVADGALGDLNVGLGTMSATVGLGSTSAVSDAVMGQIFISGANVTVDGMVAIGAH